MLKTAIARSLATSIQISTSAIVSSDLATSAAANIGSLTTDSFASAVTTLATDAGINSNQISVSRVSATVACATGSTCTVPSLSPGSSASTLSGGAIAGIVVGSVAGVSLIIVFGIWIYKRNKTATVPNIANAETSFSISNTMPNNKLSRVVSFSTYKNPNATSI